jgi:hypothetical protein
MLSPLKRLLASGTAFDYAIFVQCGSNGAICTIIPINRHSTKQDLYHLPNIQMKKACAGQAQAFHRS